jgi:hypothetical protein
LDDKAINSDQEDQEESGKIVLGKNKHLFLHEDQSISFSKNVTIAV